MTVSHDTESLRLGLLSDTPAQLGALVAALQRTPHVVATTMLAGTEAQQPRTDVDIWIVRAEAYSDNLHSLLAWFSDRDIPVVIDDGSNPRKEPDKEASWFVAKIAECMASVAAAATRLHPAKKVWVIAASTGGPEAVLDFFRALPEELGSNAFIYAQHIGAESLDALLNSLRAVRGERVAHCHSGGNLVEGHVYIVSPEQAFYFSSNRYLMLADSGWNGRYRPSINQVVAKTARAFGRDSGAIIFTGMGDDGAEALGIMSAAGGKVYVQSPETCTIDSMPQSALKTGCVQHSASVADLATYFMEHDIEPAVRKEKRS